MIPNQIKTILLLFLTTAGSTSIAGNTSTNVKRRGAIIVAQNYYQNADGSRTLVYPYVIVGGQKYLLSDRSDEKGACKAAGFRFTSGGAFEEQLTKYIKSDLFYNYYEGVSLAFIGVKGTIYKIEKDITYVKTLTCY